MTNFITRRIKQNTNSDSANVAEPIEFYQGESVRFEIRPLWFNQALLSNATTCKLFAWLPATPNSLYIDKAGTIESGQCVIELSKAEANLNFGAYTWEIQAFSEGNVLMGIVATGSLTVAYAVPQDGLPSVGPSPAYPVTLPELEDVDSDLDPTDGQLLAYNATDEVWEAVNPGAGSGDFVGPASAVAGNFVSFLDTTGKAGQDSGSKASDFATTGAIANMVTAASAFGAANRVLLATANSRAAKSATSTTISDDGSVATISHPSAIEFTAPITAIGGGANVAIAGSSTITFNNINWTALGGETIDFGPQDLIALSTTENIGWVQRFVDTGTNTFMSGGFVSSDSTLRSGDAIFQKRVPVDRAGTAKAWHDVSPCITFTLDGSNNADTNNKVDIRIYKSDANMANRVLVYENIAWKPSTGGTVEVLDVAVAGLSNNTLTAGQILTCKITFYSRDNHSIKLINAAMRFL